MKYLVPLILVGTLVLIGCSGDSESNEIMSIEQDRELISLLDVNNLRLFIENMKESSNQSALTKVTGSITVYDFDDLDTEGNCTFDFVLPNPYQDLVFIDTPYFAQCDLNGGTTLIPSHTNDWAAGLAREIKIQLPDPASSVSITALIYAFTPIRTTLLPTLIVYDASGNELGRMVAVNSNVVQTLTVTAPTGTTIDHIGLSAGQALNRWDDLTIDYQTNSPPVAHAGTDQTVECEGLSGANVTLDGSGSSPNDDALTYEWSEGGSPIATGVSPTLSLGLGTHTITLTVDDGNGETDTDEVVITVEDTQAPIVNMTVILTQLWPPNHAMHLVASGISASDKCCDATLVVEVSSSELINGTGDGDTDPDWEVVDNGDGTFDVFVRAERAGKGSGRIYIITATATDCVGNETISIGTVNVSKSKGKGLK